MAISVDILTHTGRNPWMLAQKKKQVKLPLQSITQDQGEQVSNPTRSFSAAVPGLDLQGGRNSLLG
jgi:hypothetical protein